MACACRVGQDQATSGADDKHARIMAAAKAVALQRSGAPTKPESLQPVSTSRPGQIRKTGCFTSGAQSATTFRKYPVLSRKLHLQSIVGGTAVGCALSKQVSMRMELNYTLHDVDVLMASLHDSRCSCVSCSNQQHQTHQLLAACVKLCGCLRLNVLWLQGCSIEPDRSLRLHALRLALATEGSKEGTSL